MDDGHEAQKDEQRKKQGFHSRYRREGARWVESDKKCAGKGSEARAWYGKGRDESGQGQGSGDPDEDAEDASRLADGPTLMLGESVNRGKKDAPQEAGLPDFRFVAVVVKRKMRGKASSIDLMDPRIVQGKSSVITTWAFLACAPVILGPDHDLKEADQDQCHVENGLGMEESHRTRTYRRFPGSTDFSSGPQPGSATRSRSG